MIEPRKLILAAVPWAVIGLLLLAALYVEPVSIADPVQPRPILPQDRFYDVTRVDEDRFWMVGNLGKLLRSTDGGRTWEVQSPTIEQTLQSIAAWDADNLVTVGGSGTALVSRNGGQSWDAVTVPVSEIANNLLRVRVFGDRAWIVGEFGALVKSDDRGQTWEQVLEPEDSTWHDISGAGDTLVVVGEFGRILHSTDGGESWNEIPPQVEETINAVHLRDQSHGIAVGLAGVVLVTTDGGESWSLAERKTEEHLYAVSWNGIRWLAVGANGALVTTSNGDAGWAAARVADNNFAWRTAVLQTERGWFLVGADQGFLSGDDWNPLNGNGELN